MPLNFAPKPNPRIVGDQPAPLRPVVQPGAKAGNAARAEDLKARLRSAQTPAPAAMPSREETRTRLRGVPVATAPSAQTTEAPQAPGSAPADASAAPAQGDPQNTQFAAIAWKEKQLRKVQQEIRTEKDAWAAEQAKFISRELLATDPLKALGEAGVTYDRLVELQIAQAIPDSQQALQEKIAQLEGRLAKVDETFAQRDDLQEQQALKQIRTDAQVLVDSDQAFETIKATDSVGEVVELIRRVFHGEGIFMSVEDAATLVEQKLVEREYERYQKLSQLSKIRARAASAETPAQAAPLTRTLTSQGAVSTRPMTPRDRAIARIKGEL